MYDVIRRDILQVLTDLGNLLKSNDNKNPTKIKELSNHVIHNASVFQDEDSVSVAIMIYSLSKIMERDHVDCAKFLNILSSAIEALKANNDESFRKSMKSMFDNIRSMDKKLKLYIYEVINQAQIKKGCKMCEHGLSVARAAEILGISQWELMNYLGKTTMLDNFSESIKVSSRLKFARSLFA